ncbi:MAG: kelch repeat-containing protein [Candidatus Eisenbacteria bacterium]
MRPSLTLALAVAALVACTAPALASEPAATDWAGSHPIPALDAPRPADDPLQMLPTVRRTTPRFAAGTDGGPAGDWSLVGPQAGAERFQPGVIVDPVRGRLLAFGGADDALQATTWAFTFSSGLWTPLTTAGTAPPARRLHGAVYDPLGDRMIVFGGLGASGPLDDVWQLSLAGTPTWSRIVTTNSPGARAAFAATFDAAANRLVVYGGYVPDSAYFNADAHVWVLPLAGTPEWTDITPSVPGPSPRFGFAGGWDGASRSLYVFGGLDSTESGELWRLSLAGTPAWSLVAAEGSAAPSPRAWATAGFDPVSQRFVLYGGHSTSWDDPNAYWATVTVGRRVDDRAERRGSRVDRRHARSEHHAALGRGRRRLAGR